MNNASRVATLRAISYGAARRTGSSVFNNIDIELQELGGVRRVHPERRKNLLQLLHACRALETALKAIVRSHGVTPQNSLGLLFRQLEQLPYGSPGYLTRANASRFGGALRIARNRFAHEANAFPRSSRETEVILSEVDACFSLAVK